jgi:hypothetical protein
MLELNFSCPQMARKDAGHSVGQDYSAISHFTAAVKPRLKATGDREDDAEYYRHDTCRDGR